MREISEKVQKVRVLRFPKSGPSVKIRLSFMGFWRYFREIKSLESNRHKNGI